MNHQNVILHADMDAFFASVEQLYRGLKGFPVVVGSPPDRRGVVSAASYEARQFGIHSAMPSREAYRRCPQAIFLPVNMELYRKVSRQVIQVFYDFTPMVEQISIDEAFLDVTGVMRNYQSPSDIASKLQKAIYNRCGTTASIGIAPNKFLAKLASDLNKPNGLTLVPFEQEAIINFLKPIPVSCIWGVGQKTLPLLKRINIKTIGDLQRIKIQDLKLVLKSESTANSLKRLAMGQDNRLVGDKKSKEKSISNETTFSQDCTDSRELTRGLLALVDKVAGRIRKEKLKGKVIRVKVRLSDFTTLSRQMTLPDPTDITNHLRDSALKLLAKLPIDQPVRLIGFGITKFCAPTKQQSLFQFEDTLELKKASQLDQAIDHIRQQLGEDKLKRGL
jgi:DNA polymerase-4